MDMNNKDFEAIDRALKEYSESGKIKEKCPRCGASLLFVRREASFEIRCSDNCISEVFRGI